MSEDTTQAVHAICAAIIYASPHPPTYTGCTLDEAVQLASDLLDSVANVYMG